ncbi:arogenate dehydratase/prephenate dehydratase 2, chloroplastic-like [Dorcoceras hygrometricum]|uniref:Arogenate dehydratase/prephenate dehydratase 2, chloroplastic-like n=1 Tax=Dorcoceras hygrometricum TaxID=472368 RepID=A0A2Z7B2H7_9LAMI|nr:arogenate dehydratase/prephenate dehydratase 2, chloroplastic-like [Dorcoceras hygrometricum]
MSPSVFSVAGVGTISFGLVGTTTFWISEGDSAVSSVGLQLCERSDVALRIDVGYHGYSAGRGVDPARGAPGASSDVSAGEKLEFKPQEDSLRDDRVQVLLVQIALEEVFIERWCVPGTSGDASWRLHSPAQPQRLDFRPPGASRFDGSSGSQYSGSEKTHENTMPWENVDDPPEEWL